MLTFIISAYALGILGSLHCIGMCGPLVMSMPFQQVKKGQIALATLNYHLGKTTTYALFGLMAGGLGQGFMMLKWQQSFSVFAGLILLLITLFPVVKKKFGFSLPLQKYFSQLYEKMASKTDLKYFFAFGFLNGLLPCGLVYTALAAAAVSSTPLNGFMFMAFFGLGTIPSLTFVVFFQQKVKPSYRKYLSNSSYYISIFIGILLLLRGFNLGIPYVSPSFSETNQEVKCCYKP